MNAGIERRLQKLEGAGATNGLAGLAEQLEAGRRRTHAMTPEQLAAEGAARREDLERQHAERPFRGTMLALLLAMRRVAAAELAEAAP